MEFGTRLAKYRKERGLSQDELASMVGVSRQAVSKWETDEAMPDLKKAAAVSAALGISLDRLCADNEMIEDVKTVKPETSSPDKKRMIFVCCVMAIFLCLSFFAGTRFAATKGEAGQADGAYTALPDQITVSGEGFSLNEGKLTYRFVPSAVRDDFTYKITFTSSDGEASSFDAVCTGGVCTGTADISEYKTYSVNVLIGNGKESRSVPLAYNLTFSVSEGRVSWKPEE